MHFTRRTPRQRLRSSSWMPATAAIDNETLDHLLSVVARDPCYSDSIRIRKCDTPALWGAGNSGVGRVASYGGLLRPDVRVAHDAAEARDVGPDALGEL